MAEFGIGYKISIHPPRGGRDEVCQSKGSKAVISIHPPRGGRDIPTIDVSMVMVDFNPPSPWGEGRFGRRRCNIRCQFQSTLPVGGGTGPGGRRGPAGAISIHPPRGGRDPRRICFPSLDIRFQSTLPVGGGT